MNLGRQASPQLRDAPQRAPLRDMVLIDSGIRFDQANGGDPLYSYFRIETPMGARYRCVALRELRYLTRTDREEDDILGRQWGAVRGLYNAHVNFLYVIWA